MNLFKYKELVMSSKSKYFYNNQNEDLYSIRYRLTFLKELGYDVDEYIEYVDFVLHKRFMEDMKYRKQEMIKRGHLSISCLEDCDFRCCECYRRGESYGVR